MRTELGRSGPGKDFSRCRDSALVFPFWLLSLTFCALMKAG